MNAPTTSVTSSEDLLHQPVQFLKGVGPKRAELLRRCGIVTIWDAVNYFPFRHEDRRALTLVRDVQDGAFVTICGVIDSIDERPTRRFRSIVQVGLKDRTGTLYGTWFNQPWMGERFRRGQKALFTGKAQLRPYPCISHPTVELLPDDFTPDEYEGTLTPIYRLTEELSGRVMRQTIHSALEVALPLLEEYLPEKVQQQYNLMPLPRAYRVIHAYECTAIDLTPEQLQQARRRLVLDEFFVIAMGLLLKRLRTEQMPYTVRHRPPGQLVRALLKQLPFELTSAQKRVLHEIKNDLLAPVPMNRLLQGDVGSGKTIVAVLAALMAIEGGYQVALMVPTEVLAVQHYQTITQLTKELPVAVRLLTGSTRRKERAEIVGEISSGKPMLVIGTHALIQKEVRFPRLGLAIIDEQHKFGVMQRNRLRDQAEQPDVLVMTATPIPRSLALTVYGDLSVSRIDELPSGRKPIKTYVVRPDRLPRVWEFVRKQVHAGHQAYVVYPLIDESDTLPLKPAVAMYEHLRREVFPDLRVGLVHGRMPAEERDRTMSAFKQGVINVLIATAVIEVGIDVPNATVMVVEDAHRFGLAQLHQLRGRVGRGGATAYCILVDNSPDDEAGQKEGDTVQPRQPELLESTRSSRLAVMAETNDGFRIAEEDLKLRGPGEFFGLEQTGLPSLRIADLVRDEEELRLARHIAETLLAHRDKLKPETRERIRERLRRTFGATIRGVDAG
ncbi:MAG: ATP-dependent DNA helicase RecG [bacterium]|nr:ATP-dependent DNA helicase RecG [bacterium]